LDQLTSSQLSEWEAYDKIDPVGTWRDDFRMAYLSSIVTNLVLSVHGKPGVKSKAPIDFMPDWDEDKEKVVKKQSIEEQKDILLALAGGRTRKRGDRTDFQKQARIKNRKQ